MTLESRARAVKHYLVRSLQSETGSALVEFAVTGLFFFMLLFSIIEAGRAIHHYTLIASAAREGTRWAAVRGRDSGRTTTQGQVQNHVRGKAAGLNLPNANISVTWNPVSMDPGATIQITVTHTFRTIVPIAKIGNVSMSTTARGIVLQ
jgi:Flp pilus assembly protein TadG